MVVSNNTIHINRVTDRPSVTMNETQNHPEKGPRDQKRWTLYYPNHLRLERKRTQYIHEALYIP